MDLRWFILGWYAIAGLATFVAFAWDKRRAVRGVHRIPESTLHTFEMLGGWPGALLAITLLRHKNRKPAFLVLTAIIIVLHAAVWAAVLYGPHVHPQ